MKDLLIMMKFPTPGRSKTRLGKDIGYETSAQFAKYMLEDMVAEASKTCNVTISCPNRDIDDFSRAYPDWNLCHRTGESLSLGLPNSFKYIYDKKDAEKVIAVTGDLILSEKELDSYFNHLDNSNILVGPTYDFRFYLAGFDEKYGNRFASYLDKPITHMNFFTSCIKTIATAPKIKIMDRKRDIDNLHDLRLTEFPDHYAKTQEFLKQEGYLS